MKQQINEARRMQQLAGTLNEASIPDWDNLHQQLLDLEAYLKNNINDPDNKELLSKSMGFEIHFKNYLKKKDLY